MALNPDSLDLHRAALAHHLGRLAELQNTPPEGIEPDHALRIAACDALGWAIRLYDRPILTKAEARVTTPVPDDRHHIASGAGWARNRVMHGDAHVLHLEHERVPWNAPIPWDSPLPWDPKGMLMFAVMSDPLVGDKSSWLQPFYNTCVASRLVGAVCLLISGPPAESPR